MTFPNTPPPSGDRNDNTAYGLDVSKMPNGYIPLGCVVLTKALTPTGAITFFESATHDSLNGMEQLGMVQSYADTLRARLMGSRQYSRTDGEGNELPRDDD